MVPTLLGRIQTRFFLLATVGVIVTLLIVPVLPGPLGSLGDRYVGGFLVLVAVGVLGIVWELALSLPHAVPVGEGLADPARFADAHT